MFKEYKNHMVRGFKDLRHFDEEKELNEFL